MLPPTRRTASGQRSCKLARPGSSTRRALRLAQALAPARRWTVLHKPCRSRWRTQGECASAAFYLLAVESGAAVNTMPPRRSGCARYLSRDGYVRHGSRSAFSTPGNMAQHGQLSTLACDRSSFDASALDVAREGWLASEASASLSVLEDSAGISGGNWWVQDCRRDFLPALLAGQSWCAETVLV